jgi:preprotein translocase subunit SecD
MERIAQMKINFGWRVWLLIIVLLLSILAIRPNFFGSGVVVKSVDKDSSIYTAGLRTNEIITSINGQGIKNQQDYARVIDSLFPNNFTGDVKLEIKTKSNDYVFLSNETPRITVENVPKTKIQTGLDLRGGARALVKADVSLTDDKLQDLVETSRNRFNVYGLSDINVRGVTDLSGNKFMLIEVAGASPQDLTNLIGQQGKFTATIGNTTVFDSDRGDIKDVCKNNAQCAGIRSCTPSQDGSGYICSFQFAVYLSPEAAKKHADITRDLGIDDTGQYLSQKIYLYVDEKEVNSLLIGASLRGQETTEISVQGSGSGKTQQEALTAAQQDMNTLQTILKTGSLPYKLEIVKLDTISPTLGGDFVYLILEAGALSIIVVAIIVFARYRKIKESLALLLTSFSEIVIILGIAALLKWNLDLPSIAGILATIGTGVDQQIVILDEAKKNKLLSIAERLKRALFIIMSSYFTALVSLLPLYWAGAGLFKGFAFTTIIGITAGVLITRPAFAEMVRRVEG